MSVETFADPEVKKIMEASFVFLELDVDQEKEAAGWFAPEAIPDTSILSPEGKVLDRVVGFMPAGKFSSWLKATLEKEKR